MKKYLSNIVCFVLGGVIFGCAVAYANEQYNIYINSFPVTINGGLANIQGYNVDGSSYFSLRQIGLATGTFNVEFVDNTIQITTNNVEEDTTSDNIKDTTSDNIIYPCNFK